tara:strand:- start:4627 stop:4890 length:264 start_codon:yes stop_codon:yes gene_type:complete
MSLEELSEINPEALQADGFEKAFIGYVERCGQQPTACYDKAKLLKHLVADGLSYEEAIEHFEYNINGSFVGEFTPFYLTKTIENEDE